VAPPNRQDPASTAHERADVPASERPTGSSPPSAFAELILVRLSGDLTTKADATRKRFVGRLIRNVKDALKSRDCRHRVDRSRSRLYVHTERPGMADVLRRVFGIQSVSVVEARRWSTVDDIVDAGAEIFADTVRGKRFAVRARRVGDRKKIHIVSVEIERRLGARLEEHAAGVDLDDPECTAYVEVMIDHAYFHSGAIDAEGGLPLGCEGRAVSLVSGGFDSPVATWRILRRGVALDYVFCNLGGRSHQLETLRVMKVVADEWSHGLRPKFHAVEFEDVSAEIQEKTSVRYWQVILKRMMYRAADAVAADVGGVAVVTGEALGQVSSQTLQNLAVIERATLLPVLRPLVGDNKQEIISQSRRIGTHDLSARVGEHCAMVPTRPATRALLEDVEREEASMDPSVLERAIAERTIFDLRHLDLARMDAPDIAADGIERGATVIDVRSKAAFDRWHYPGALHLEFAQAMAAHPHFDATQRYVVYCEFGLKSAHLADRMRAAGLDAQHVRGGEKAVVKLAHGA
jgi:thiamine biosynthesis protein ThiI